jgi:type I restriction enzyme S subunit
MSLPRGWVEVKAVDVCEMVQSGGTPKNGVMPTEEVPFLKVYNLVNQEVGFDAKPQFVSRKIHERELSKSRAIPGDVLMNIVGPPLGKIAIVPDTYDEWNFNQAITAFRPSEAIISKFIYWYLCGGDSVQSIIRETRGIAGQVNISLSQCRNFAFPLPPAAEQRRIVSKLDALTARIARARAELDRVPVLANMFRSRCLSVVWQLAPRCSLSDYIASPIRNGLSIKGSDTPPGVSALRLSSIRNRTVDLNDVRYLPIDETKATAYALIEGDVLVSRGNGTLSLVGKASRVENVPLDRPIIFPDTAFRIRLDPRKASPRWLTFVWNSAGMRKQIEAKARTTAGIWKISQGDLNSFNLPKLSVPEQEKSADLIEAAFARADRLEAEAARARKLLDRLESAILAKAFRGELVPQDENDEPAEKLLERIRAERAAAPKVKRGRKSRA